MRAIVCADMEGIGGIDRFEGCFPSWQREYAAGRVLMEGEVNAAIAGLRDSGIDDVVVTDWHFAGTNLRRDRVDAPVESLWLHGEPRMDQNVYGPRDIAVFVGMHAAAGADAFMAHTFWQGLAVEVDGVAVNEAYLWAEMVGAAGARVGLVVGEERVVDECAVLLPQVPVLSVKSTIDRDTARTSVAVEELRERIRQAVRDAVQAGRERRAPDDGRDREVRVTFHQRAWAVRAEQQELGTRVGPRTVAATLTNRDDLIPYVARCALATPSGRETSLYSRVAPAPERTSLPERVRTAIAGCLHTVGRPVMRHGVRATQRMDQALYPAPPLHGRAPGR